MNRVPPTVWIGLCVVVTLFNAAAGAYAWWMLREELHGWIHMLLAVLFGGLGFRLWRRLTPG